jgi:hypothetical protein
MTIGDDVDFAQKWWVHSKEHNVKHLDDKIKQMKSWLMDF